MTVSENGWGWQPHLPTAHKVAVSSVFGACVSERTAFSMSRTYSRSLTRLRQVGHWLAAPSDISPVSTTDVNAERAGASDF